MAQNEKVKKQKYEDVLQIISNNIRKARKQRGLTQEDMAEQGFNYRYYQKLESGSYSPNLKTLYRLANAFNVPVKDFFS